VFGVVVDLLRIVISLSVRTVVAAGTGTTSVVVAVVIAVFLPLGADGVMAGVGAST
jgi:hypothetical protein